VAARLGVLFAALAAVGLAAGCSGSSRTALPSSASATTATSLATTSTAAVTTTAGPTTTASPYKSAGERFPLAGGTVAASYPRVGVRAPAGTPPLPAGPQWALLNVELCAGKTAALPGRFVDPNRFQVEVPGQGFVKAAAGAPALSKTPLVAGGDVPVGRCAQGAIPYVVGGEGHIESIAYDAGDGLLRWAS
jgi:hypothetical protein